MKPSFALDFTSDGLVLLHRSSQGWFRVGEVALDAPDLAEQMRFLHRKASELSPQGVTTKLIIPNSQILYTEVEAPGQDRATRRAQIARALEGRTPYNVEDLVFDWSGTGSRVLVAVVARLTLEEAEAFAVENRFLPLCFVATPDDGRFAGEPYFGPSATSGSVLPAGDRIERDQDPVRVIGRIEPEPGADAPATAVGAAFATAQDRADPSGESPAVVAAALPVRAGVLDDASPDEAPMLVDIPPEPGALESVVARLSGVHPADIAEFDSPAEDENDPDPAVFVRHAPVSEGAATVAETRVTQPVAAPKDAAPPRAGLSILAPEVDAPVFAEERGEPAEPPARMRGQKPPRPSAPRAILRAEPAEPPPPASLRSHPKPPEAEERELTVFGARKRDGVGGRPRYLAAWLIGGLLLVMAAIGLWSQWFGADPSTGAEPAASSATVTGAASEDTTATTPAPAQPAAPAPTPETATETVPPTMPETAAAPASRPGSPAQPEPTPDIPATAEAPSAPAPAPDATSGTSARSNAVDESGIAGALAEAMGDDAAAPKPAAETPPAAAADSGAQAAPPADPQSQTPAPTAPAPAAPADAASAGAASPAPGATRAIWGETGPADEAGTSGQPPAREEPVATDAPAPAAQETAPSADAPPPAAVLPTPFASLLQIGPDGLIIAKPEGVVTPDGYTLYAGRPKTVPAQRPPVVLEAARIAAGLPPPDPLEGKKPRLRPASLVVPAAPAAEVPPGAAAAPVVESPAPVPAIPAPVSPLTLPAAPPPMAPATTPDDQTSLPPPVDPHHAALAPRDRPTTIVEIAALMRTPLAPPVAASHGALQPRTRPAAVVAAAAQIRANEIAVAEAAAAAALAEQRASEAMASASRLAIEQSRRPAQRPSDMTQAVEAVLASALATPAEAAEPPPADVAHDEIDEPEPSQVAPSIPTRASVAKQATIANALDLAEINLIGVYGAPRDRRALVRLSSGRYVKVQIGDRLDGGQVAAIGEGELSYVKNGRTIVLKMIKQS